MSQVRGGSEKFLPSVCSDLRTTNFVARKMAACSRPVNFPVRFEGKILARHKISSPIQLPIPEKPGGMSKTALIGAFRCRSKNGQTNFRDNSGESISGLPEFYKSDAPSPHIRRRLTN